ncbi:MAG: hypothetical protein ABI551_21955 [Polyangiaceae bacterium]
MDRRWLALVCFVSAAAACGGTDSALLGPSGSEGADDAGTRIDSGSSGLDSGGGTTTSDASGSDDGGSTPDGSATTDAGGGGSTCPDVTGAYSIKKSGFGCNDLSEQASECIADDGPDCHEQFLTKKGGTGFGSGSGVSGEVVLDAAGDFPGVTLKLGTQNKDGCTGTWDAAGSTMTIVCGSGALSCTIKLTRTCNVCPK